VQVTAVPGSGASFSGWSGDLNGSTNPTTITMTSNKSITATFIPATTVTFQEGVSGYTGTVDTFIRGTTEGNTNFGSSTVLEWDENTGTTTDEIALIRFTNIFSSAGGSIPDGATIVSASLTYKTTDLNSGSTANGDPANVYESLVDWPEATVTYNNFGGDVGVQADEYVNLVASAPATALSTAYTIDVTASLQRWIANPSTNHLRMGSRFMQAKIL
jgi:Divergent InlB B-repeat domain